MASRKRGSSEARQPGGDNLDLAHKRQRLGIALADIAQTTKISMRFLLAIEAEKFEELPGGVFTTNYLRQYADAVRLDPADLFAAVRKRAGSETSLEPALASPSRSVLGKLFRLPA